MHTFQWCTINFNTAPLSSQQHTDDNKNGKSFSFKFEFHHLQFYIIRYKTTDSHCYLCMDELRIICIKRYTNIHTNTLINVNYSNQPHTNTFTIQFYTKATNYQSFGVCIILYAFLWWTRFELSSSLIYLVQITKVYTLYIILYIYV